jgi:ribosome maturation factor RimP
MDFRVNRKKEILSSSKKNGEQVRLFPNHMKDFLLQVCNIVEPVCESEGMELVHVEYQKEPAGRILRLYIDKPGGVTLEDCAATSRQVSDLLDIYMEGKDSYRLEVSSPGTNRPLGRVEDFDRFKTYSVRIKSLQPINGQKNFKGTLIGIEDRTVKIMVNDQPVAINIEDIAKARLINHIGES